MVGRDRRWGLTAVILLRLAVRTDRIDKDIPEALLSVAGNFKRERVGDVVREARSRGISVRGVWSMEERFCFCLVEVIMWFIAATYLFVPVEGLLHAAFCVLLSSGWDEKKSPCCAGENAIPVETGESKYSSNHMLHNFYR